MKGSEKKDKDDKAYEKKEKENERREKEKKMIEKKAEKGLEKDTQQEEDKNMPGKGMNQESNRHIYEISWEVCNKVGGIWTVITSKAGQVKKHYGRDYTCIGPYFADKVIGQFEEEPAPEDLKKTTEELEKKGIILHFGKWLIKGLPKVILVDYTNFRFRTDDIKKELWDNFRVDSLNSNSPDYNEPIVWAYAVGIVLESIQGIRKEKAVAQFHEWLAGPALLYLKIRDSDIATVFTTHATVMGRALSSANIDLFCKNKDNKCNIETIDVDRESYDYHVEGKHLIEKAAAGNSDAFTTVSEITGLEAAHVLKRKPDQILPNGLDNDKFPTFEESSIEHERHRDFMREFIMYYFFPYYQFDIKNTLFYFLAGRYELRNKGIDVYINALAELNEKLKKEKSEKTIVAFIFVPTGVRGIKLDLLENKSLFQDIHDTVKEDSPVIIKNILYTLAAKQELKKENIFPGSFLDTMKSKSMRFKKKGTPPLMTHDLQQYGDQIVDLLLKSGLDNMEDDKVKVIFYPIYLNGADGLLDSDYYESMQSCHLGVFPSFYEPWGYTPLEAAALGVSSVTTDLAGFGKYIQKKKDSKYPGIFVLKRMDRTDSQIVADLSDFMHKFARFTRQERVKNKIEAKKIAGTADWSKLIMNYLKAHELALQNSGKKEDNQKK